MAILINFADNGLYGCSGVVLTVFLNYSRKVIKISAFQLKEDFDIIVELKCLVV